MTLSTNYIVKVKIVVIFLVLVIIQYPKLLRAATTVYKSDSILSHDAWKEVCFIIRVLIRYLLFSLCMVSYFWDEGKRKPSDSLPCEPEPVESQSNCDVSTVDDSPNANGKSSNLLSPLQNSESKEHSVSPSSMSSETNTSMNTPSTSSGWPAFLSHFDGYTDFGLNNFLQIGFTAFWPRRTVAQPIIRWASTLAIFAIPLFMFIKRFIKIMFIQKELTFLWALKLFKTFTSVALLWIGIYFGSRFFSRPALYTEDVKLGTMPWQKYRNQYSGGSGSLSSTRMSRRATSSKWIIIGLVISSLLEAYLMEIQHLNVRQRRNTLRRIDGAEATRWDFWILLFQFVTGNWQQVLLPVFVYPPEIIIVLITCSLFPMGSKVLKGLMTYCLLISGHTVMVTILSLVIVWEIERFDRDLKHNMICIFERNPSDNHGDNLNDNSEDNQHGNIGVESVRECAKNRLHVFDQMKIKRDELIPQLSTLFHFLVIDRLTISVLDFWVWTCDRKVDFNVAAFMTRHSFQLVLMCWVVYKMVWPLQLKWHL